MPRGSPPGLVKRTSLGFARGLGASPGKQRADLLLVEQGLAESRARAQALLLSGRVYLGEQRVDKPGALLPRTAPLSVRQPERYVSRGGYKLEGALRALELSLEGAVVLDVGASTGGFTDCALQHGARRVYAVDVGQGQLAPRLASDARVVVRDRCNARALGPEDFPEPIEVVTVDASFIGVAKLLPAIAAVLPSGGRLLAMIKPQFEVGLEVARRSRGVIRDPVAREAALEGARRALEEHGFERLAESDSALPGPRGNVERFMLARRR